MLEGYNGQSAIPRNRRAAHAHAPRPKFSRFFSALRKLFKFARI